MCIKTEFICLIHIVFIHSSNRFYFSRRLASECPFLGGSTMIFHRRKFVAAIECECSAECIDRVIRSIFPLLRADFAYYFIGTFANIIVTNGNYSPPKILEMAKNVMGNCELVLGAFPLFADRLPAMSVCVCLFHLHG